MIKFDIINTYIIYLKYKNLNFNININIILISRKKVIIELKIIFN